MRRGLWALLLLTAASIGLNAGLLYSQLREPRVTEILAPEPPFIQPGPPPLAPDVGRQRLHRMETRLNLAPEQRRQLQGVFEATMPEILEARLRVQEARRAVQAEYSGGQPDPHRVHAAIRAMSLAQTRLDSLAAEAMLREIEVLGADQVREYLNWLPWEHDEPGVPGLRRKRHGR